MYRPRSPRGFFISRFVLSDGGMAGYICSKITAMPSLVEQHFVREVLAKQGDRLLYYQGNAIREKTNAHSGNLFAQRRIDVSSGDEFSGKLAFTHKIYERFLDMKAVQRGRRTIRQNRKIHNRFIEYTLANIEYKLLYGFTDEVAQRIKAQFNEQNPQ